MKNTTLPVRDMRGAGIVLVAAGLAWPLVNDHVSVPCPLRTLTGIPCPLCGMTTSVVATTHGDLATGLAANPAGVLAVAGALWLLVTRRDGIAIPNLVLVAIVAGMWVFQLLRFQVL